MICRGGTSSGCSPLARCGVHKANECYGPAAVVHDAAPAYGLWGLVIVNSAVFILFAYSFFKPQTSRDWRSFGAFSAFLLHPSDRIVDGSRIAQREGR